MCVIVIKEKGKELPPKEILSKCFYRNSDGCGFMYNFQDKVFIEKGFMDFEVLYNRLIELDEQILLKNRGLVIHFRIATSGLVDMGNCHPYPIVNERNSEYMRAMYLSCDKAFCHNGIISDYSDSKSKFNDTQLFGMKVLSVFNQYDTNFFLNKDVMDILSKICKSKLCFLDKRGNIYKIGTFEKFNGYEFSNLLWKENVPKNTNCYMQTSFWEDYDDIDDIENDTESEFRTYVGFNY